jgi:NAD(P)-dependent dehydrogenase (short-subunit alcohol dehydrogenase family)
MTKPVALEHGNPGICVNAVAPGPTVTVMADRFRSATQANNLPVATVPLGRRATPEEMANAIVFISSPEASCIAGAVFEVDGGLSAH